MQRAVDFATSKIGCGYIYGAMGWVCSEARRKQQAAQYPEQYNNIMVIGKKWDGVQCYDCAQLTRYAANAAGGYLPSGANSQWKGNYWTAKGEISAMPLNTPCFVYRLKDGIAQHTGVYIGDGWVVEARGVKEGVIKSKLSDYAWTHYAIHTLANIITTETPDAPYLAVVKTKTGSGVGLWSNNEKTTKYVTIPEGAQVTVKTTPDTKGFALAMYADKLGYADAQYLVPIADEKPIEAETLYTVTLPSVSAAIKDAVLDIWPGALVYEVKAGGNG